MLFCDIFNPHGNIPKTIKLLIVIFQRSYLGMITYYHHMIVIAIVNIYTYNLLGIFHKSMHTRIMHYSTFQMCYQ